MRRVSILWARGCLRCSTAQRSLSQPSSQRVQKLRWECSLASAEATTRTSKRVICVSTTRLLPSEPSNLLHALPEHGAETNMGRVAFLLLAGAAAFDYLVPPKNLTFESMSTPALSSRPWPFSPAAGRTFTVTSTCCGYGVFTPAAVANASEAHGLFDVPCLPDSWPVLAEWGYEFMNDEHNIFPVCGNATVAGRGRVPTTREEAVSWLSEYWVCRSSASRSDANATASSAIVSEIGHYLFAGLSATFPNGPVIPGSEVGENINSINLHLAVTRGVARAAAAPFLIDFSSWMAGFISDFSPPPGFWGAASSPVGGHSPSLVRRTYFASFAAGAGVLVAEAGAVNFFGPAPLTPPFSLSPLGEIGAELFAYTHAEEDVETVRGIPYVPIALVTPFDWGGGLGLFYDHHAWDTFALDPAESRLEAVFDALYSSSLIVEKAFDTPRSEQDYLVPVRWGEAYDVLDANFLSSSARLVQSYRAIVVPGFGGVLPPSKNTVDALVDYVTAGGTLVLHADDAPAFGDAFLGVHLGGISEMVRAVAARDEQTGWVSTAPPAIAPFCVPQDAKNSSFYIKTGGDPSITNGWDGGTDDKCCSSTATDCLWFGSASGCASSLPLVPVICRACGAVGDVGCPAWAPPGQAGVATNVTPSALTTAVALITLTLSNSSTVTAATINAVGNGIVVVQLFTYGGVDVDAGSESGLNLTAHFLDRIANDTQPVLVSSNVSTDGSSGGVSLFQNRIATGWRLTVINSNGVVKQPNSTAVIDGAQGRNVSLTLRSSAGTVKSAWAADGGGPRQVLQLVDTADGTAVACIIEAGGLRIVDFELVGTEAK